MTDSVQGIVKAVSEKPTSNGGTMYNVCIIEEGAEAKGEWFGHGFDEPIFGKGDEIAFDIKYNGEYANVDTATVEVLEAAKKAAPTRGRGRQGGRGESKGSTASSSRSRPAKASSGDDDKMSKDDWAKKDLMIQHQACMNTSIKLVGLLLSNDAVALPKKKADMADAIVALCDEEADRLLTQYREDVYGKPASKGRGRTRSSRDEEYDDDIPQ